ncbi:hypothetical protein AAKU55_000034 [Oxalobacteraceae bacterium GrIS 1.11]
MAILTSRRKRFCGRRPFIRYRISNKGLSASRALRRRKQGQGRHGAEEGAEGKPSSGKARQYLVEERLNGQQCEGEHTDADRDKRQELLEPYLFDGIILSYKIKAAQVRIRL